MPASPFSPGKIVVLSKSGTLLYEISNNLTSAGFGQNITIGIGGDPVNGTRMIDAFDMVKDDPDIDGMVVVGEIGGEAEEILAQHIIDTGFKKPIVGYIAGRRAPKEKRMGHAGAIVMGTYGSAESKITMFAKANIPVAKRPGEIAILLAGKMNSQQALIQPLERIFMPVADPLKKQIAQKARLYMKICISCGARLDINATRCRKCKSSSLRLKNRALGIKK